MSMNDQINNNNTDSDTRALGFLTWLDTLERLDTLLLEARHLQKNILYFLREQKLYDFLDHEECFIWLDCEKKLDDGKNILEELNDIGVDKKRKQLAGLLDQIIKLYPPLYPSEKSSQAGTGKPDDLEKTVYRRLNCGFWNREQRSHYFNLTAIQKIKRNILRDKLLLCHYGIKTFKIISGKTNIKVSKFELSRFILFRCLILARARSYVDRLGDHQDIFTNNQDVGLLHPRPSARRRREQDLYNVHLSDRCKDIVREMNLLMTSLIKSNDKSKSQQLVFHHWQHDSSSFSYSFMDELEAEDEDTTTPHQHYIKTSYWMPERPDLQSEIAHEIAHSIIRERLGNLSWQDLDSSESDFCLLLKQLDQCCAFFEVNKYSAMIFPRQNFPRQEIAADLLATSVAGPAYLHALFLELLGYGLEDMFAINDNDPDHFEVRLIDYLESVIGSYSHIRDWYYRLHLVCTWLEEIDETATKTATKGALCQRLINSCREILEGLFEFLESNTPPKDKYGDYWRTLTDRLCKIVKESDVVSQVKMWRKERREDHRSEKWEKGARKFPRFTRPLHPRLRNFLFEGFIGKKIALIQQMGLSDKKETEVHEQINKVYQLIIEKPGRSYLEQRSSLDVHIGPPKLICKSLFEQIYDIPWQCAFLRGLDFVDPNSCIRPPDPILWFKQMHGDAALGRELYQLGLDFYLHDIESPRNRLLEIMHVFSNDFFSNDFIKEHPTLANPINSWKTGNNDINKFTEKVKELMDLKKKSNSKYQESCDDTAKNYSPQLLLKVYQTRTEEDERRILSKLQGLKLKQLLEIIRNLDEVEPLRTFLEVRDIEVRDKRKDPGFHSFLFQAFSKEEIKDDQAIEKWNCPDTYLITRICSTSSLDPMPSLDKSDRDRRNAYKSWVFDFYNKKIILDPSDIKEASSRSLVDKLRLRTRPLHPTVATMIKNIKDYENYQAILGRYDWLTIRKLKPMCRYGIPRFPGETGDKPVFLNNFTRREMALPVRLGTKKSWDDVHKWDINCKDTNIFALISIKLNRYTSRLDFLTRLLHVTRGSTTTDRNSNPSNLNQLRGYIHEDFGDRAFLTDGWGDILLILGNERLPHDKDKLIDIFKIQSVLFQDFQVDRTELILTPKCLSIAVKHLDLFFVIFQFRLMGHCTLEQINDSCVNSLQKSIQENFSHEPDVGVKFKVYRIPGRLDFIIHLEKISSRDGYILTDPFFEKMINIFCGASGMRNIDRIQTTIGILQTEVTPTRLPGCD